MDIFSRGEAPGALPEQLLTLCLHDHSKLRNAAYQILRRYSKTTIDPEASRQIIDLEPCDVTPANQPFVAPMSLCVLSRDAPSPFKWENAFSLELAYCHVVDEHDVNIKYGRKSLGNCGEQMRGPLRTWPPGVCRYRLLKGAMFSETTPDAYIIGPEQPPRLEHRIAIRTFLAIVSSHSAVQSSPL